MNWKVIAAAAAASLLSLQAEAACSLGNGAIKHVVYLQFDNTHFLRDNVNVPSDLEQMPALLNFLTGKGMLLANDHTQLISHTANGIITSITGVYPDRTGAGAISNSFNYYNATTGSPAHFNSSFVYWTNLLSGDNTSTGAPNPGADTSFVLVDENGRNAPAPWPAYTKAGCDFAAVGIADMDLENTNTDLANVFGANSPEYAEGTSSSSTTRNQAIADFEGIALHCAKGSAVCAAASSVSKVSADVLPQEPGGYAAFQAVFGHKYVVPALQQILGQTPNGQLNDLAGNPIGYLTVSSSNGQLTSSVQSGFPGFDGMFPSVTLSYAATMLEAGVPVVYGYFSDAHDHHYATADGVSPPGSAYAYGPGEQGYVHQLAQYNQAFATFFARLKNDGIDETNTLFVILVEEGDKFVGAKGQPAGCDGVTTPCTYPPIATTGTRPSKGEVAANLDTLLATERGNNTPFEVHTDQAPTFYLYGNPAPTDPVTRQFERDTLALTAPDAYLNNRSIPVLVAAADRAALSMLHMVTADPLRTPSFVGFNYDDFYAGKGAVTNSQPGCSGQAVCTNPAFAWNHGGTTSVVRQAWSGMVGPGVKAVGVDLNTWADHTDTRATMFSLLGLNDAYLHDGRVIVEDLDPAKLPAPIANNLAAYEQLAVAYKQLTAPFGQASTAGLRVSTAALGSGAAGSDGGYASYLSAMQTYVSNRNTVVGQIKTLLNGAAAGTGFDAGQAAQLTSAANALTAQIVAAANNPAY